MQLDQCRSSCTCPIHGSQSWVVSFGRSKRERQAIYVTSESRFLNFMLPLMLIAFLPQRQVISYACSSMVENWCVFPLSYLPCSLYFTSSRVLQLWRIFHLSLRQTCSLILENTHTHTTVALSRVCFSPHDTGSSRCVLPFAFILLSHGNNEREKAQPQR